MQNRTQALFERILGWFNPAKTLNLLNSKRNLASATVNMSDHWSRAEVEATISDYFEMFAMQFRGEQFNKAEHKTTRFGAFTPFFASKNEVEVSETRENEYQLYRLFSFDRQPKLFVLPGSIRKTCSLDPMQYSALPR
jgi:hypothetical protein